MSAIKDVLSKWKWSERKICQGLENKDKTFFVIRRNSKTVGLFSYVLTVIGYLKIAEENGYIPVVDMQNYLSPYLSEKGKQNVWEYYFKQPGGYSLDDIRHSRNIILSSGEVPLQMPGLQIFSDKQQLTEWRNIYQKYVRLNAETEAYINELRAQLWGKEKVLGVLCRGTDYRDLKPKKHPIQPEVADVIAMAKKAMLEAQCEKIYLATEDKEILEQFRQEFGDVLIFPDINLRPYKKNELISTIEVEREDDKRLKGLEYLAQIELLSRCNCFIGSGCGGSYAALLMSPGFEWQYLWDLGVY